MSFVRFAILILSCSMYINIAQATTMTSHLQLNSQSHSTHSLFIHQDVLNQPQLQLSENALNKQKQNLNNPLSEHDDLVLLNTIHAAPTQNFFAAQQQRFSRFLQNLFSLCNS
ncbi:DUF4179 domain-containing protein [Acinetobacter sp. B5B]|uniref:DUF4179 domain-containing protein n=1 Tax=Acinetobacter baretiae TaxID=2605383 RepID=UPI0018C2B409|nr:DUF4179 domain-containing protein [Acinetobacter baretiae]MBF7682203.1 DUF4179 domain-containing protein [Acinetobacter baretiae]